MSNGTGSTRDDHVMLAVVAILVVAVALFVGFALLIEAIT